MVLMGLPAAALLLVLARLPEEDGRAEAERRRDSLRRRRRRRPLLLLSDRLVAPGLAGSPTDRLPSDRRRLRLLLSDPRLSSQRRSPGWSVAMAPPASRSWPC